MAEFLVLVNGLPGSGKTTLGRSLAVALGAEFLSKDTVKEALADCVADAAAIPELGGIAMDAVWALARAAPGTVVIDSWWFRPRDLSFAATGIDKSGADRVVEVWCDIPAELAKARYADRRRAAIHRDEQRLVSDWAVWAAQAEPLDLAPTVRVDTARPVCGAEVAVEVERVAVRWTRG
ncbi:AAA family ATPase [Nocardia sp. XZ_19_369]|uniref:AAA family ATPase n=1 Tax=Nocardia sp. XZ_19_369 TaxID=2769487 RepID=UPI00188F5F19|nr:AAA family ATPase [Nocardia sp. XZ_19_369]